MAWVELVKSCELTKLRQLAESLELMQLAEGFRQVEPAKSCELVKSGKLTKPRQPMENLRWQLSSQALVVGTPSDLRWQLSRQALAVWTPKDLQMPRALAMGRSNTTRGPQKLRAPARATKRKRRSA